ncbi:MAG: glycosyltransferase family 4 protein [Candidatus Brocadiaceae bacterium]|nr:glycosyltransferase family 4 protein [Candidatus Brocadiaceae bacterium]
MRKKILIISYHFPPSTEVGGVRPAKFAKYLPEFGWEPHVLTIKEKRIKLKDQSRLKDVEETRIFRVTAWPNLMEILLKFRNLIFLRSVTNNSKSSSKITSKQQILQKKKKSVIRLVDRYLCAVFEFPDQMVGWLLPAVWNGYWLIKKEKIEWVLTTSPPLTVSLVGLILSKLTKIKLITDLRDPLALHGGAHVISGRFSDYTMGWIEKNIVYASGRIISTTEQYANLLRSRYPEVTTSKFCTVFNGYDSNDYKFSGTFNDVNDSFVLTYLGTFYYGRTPREFLEALSQLCRENIISIDKLKVNFIGNVRYVDGVPIEEIVKKTDLSGCINISDKIPYRESLMQMEKSVVLLLFAPEQYYAIPAKTFEYLFAKRYILCFAKDGATADLINGTECGAVTDPYDIEEIKHAIKKLYRHWKSRKRLTPNQDLFNFDRRELTCKLSKILSGL